MNRWARAWWVFWLTAATVLAAPLLDEPVATLKLQDGTVLRQAQAKGFLTKVVLVQCEGGVRTVPYGQFPPEYQAALALKRQATLAAMEKQAQRQQSRLAPAPRSPPPPVVPKWDMTATFRLSASGSTGDVIMVRIENLSDFVAAVYPEQIAARTQSGKLVAGTHWVGLNDAGSVVMTLKNRQLIDGRATVILALAVSPGLDGDYVASVFWK